jgi:hypothetical protein
VWRGFEPARQTAFELKSHHRAIAKPRQLVKKITDRSFQLEFIGTGELRPATVAAQAGDTHDLQIQIGSPNTMGLEDSAELKDEAFVP